MTRPLRIVLLDHMGLGNLGDAATQDAVIHLIRRRRPAAEIALASLNPADSAQRHGLPSFAIASSCAVETAEPTETAAPAETAAPVADETADHAPGRLRSVKQALQRIGVLDRVIVGLWRGKRELAFLRRCRQRLKHVDLLIVSGGGQIDDSWGGPSGAPLNLLRWSLLARTTGTEVAYLSVGAGPLRHRSSRWMVRLALALARVRSVRDEASRRLLAQIGVRRRVEVHPDLAHALPAQAAAPSGSGEALVIGIGPLPYLAPRWWPDKDEAGYRRYVEALAELAIWADSRGHRVRFLLGETHMDATVVDDIRELVTKRAGEATTSKMPAPRIESVDDLVAAIGETDVVVSSRFHGVLLAQRLGRPVIAPSYHPKVESLMIDMGQAKHVVPIDDCSLDALVAAFEDIRPRVLEWSSKLIARSHAHRERLDSLFDGVFGSALDT